MEAPPPPPALLDELVEEILLCLPPEDPACLLRASVVCKAWSGIASRPGFRRRLHELHGVPPVLVFLHNWKDDFIPRFISTTASSFSLAAPDRRAWRAVDCRHGRALFFPQGSGGLELLLWEPITGAQQRIPVPAAFNCDDFWTAAVLCAADGCDHRDCVGGPFRVVFLFVVVVDEETSIYSSSIYSSETGAWGELTSVQRTVHFSVEFKERYSVLVDRSVLYFMSDGVASCASVVEYDLASHNLTVFGLPDTDHGHAYSLVLVEDGGIGVIQYLDTQLKFWTREASAEAGWVLNRVMCLENSLPMNALLHAVQVLGFAEEANVIFVNTVVGIYTIELRSGHVREVCSDTNRGFCSLIPVVSFYTPVPRGKHQNLPASKPSGEAGGEEGGEEEKTVDQAQQLLNKGSNATKEVDFINTFEYVSLDLEIRVPCYGEGALEGARTLNKPGCALLPKDSSADVPKSAPSLCLCFHLGLPGVCECTTRRDDAGNSTTSESNVEDLWRKIAVCKSTCPLSLVLQSNSKRKRSGNVNTKKSEEVSESAGWPE
ncbi:hypothetical protein CFC21_080660 [Triticum aestivum]|uniref:F-box domain-containing protein n=2 Tax=Triticum aestivum TaxID=4565 RepID=A0A3B6N2S4_WHEAT|nr:uncharacterized protein LOC123123583 isoform X1 [Triticum aestivum]KAF7075934.1 hypothetical protein CFC21_080660 [Triticum aestivum]